MKIYGLDFTSAPDSTNSKARKVKRLMLAVCELCDGVLKLEEFRILNTRTGGDFSGFDAWLDDDEKQWVAGIDFPFGQPAQLISELGWPDTWERYVAHVATLGKEAFEQALNNYKASKPEGEKHLFRCIDKMTKSQSPMTLEYTPVGKMFFQGATRLLRADVSILPMRPKEGCQRIVVEAYPALVTRKWIGIKQGYKNDDMSKSDKYMDLARCDIVSAIRGHDRNCCRKPFKDVYGFTLEMSDRDAKICTEDATGDSLDSVLCAVQAAWAHMNRDANYGIPHAVDALEGWICDPETVQPEVRS